MGGRCPGKRIGSTTESGSRAQADRDVVRGVSTRNRGPLGLEQAVRCIDLVAGPVLGGLLSLTLPHEHHSAAGETASFAPTGRVTRASMAEMAWLAA